MDPLNLSYSDRFNLRTASTWGEAFDDEKYIMKDGWIFFVKTLDDIVELESRFIEINSKWIRLKSDFHLKIDDRMYLNSNTNIAIWVGNDLWDVWYREPNQKELFSTNLYSDNAKGWLGRNTILYEKESVLTKLYQKQLRFSCRAEVFRTALAIAIERFINKTNNYIQLEKEYNKTGKVSNALMAFDNKLVVLNFSGREYWYKYSKEYRTRGADRIPRLYKICWSDNIPTKFSF